MSNNSVDQLASRAPDYLVAAARAALGSVPFAGSLLAELAGTVVPNQRIERLVDFARRLEARLSASEQQLIRVRLTDEHFSDFLEESVRQVARSVSDERRERIVALLRNSLQSESISFVESKHLLRILGEINDIELLRLSSHLFTGYGSGQQFREQHREVIEDPSPTFDAPESAFEKATLRNSFDEHLAQLGLLSPQHFVDRRTGHLSIDDRTGELQVRAYAITSLGQLLLKQLGIEVDDQQANLRMEPTRHPSP